MMCTDYLEMTMMHKMGPLGLWPLGMAVSNAEGDHLWELSLDQAHGKHLLCSLSIFQPLRSVLSTTPNTGTISRHAALVNQELLLN